jgi:type IV secretion system protein VirD4
MAEQIVKKTKDFDPYGDTRLAQNFINVILVLGLAYFFLSAITFTISFTFFEGLPKLKALFKGYEYSPFKIYPYLYERYKLYCKFFISAYGKIGFTGRGFFGIKLVFSTIFPVLVFIFLLKFFKIDIRQALIRFGKSESLFGNAHWAEPSEVKKAGLFNKEGMLLGEYRKGKYFIAKDYQHVLLFAPTGSGKGVGFVIPNLLFWKESVVVHDIKLENYDLTSGYRAKVLKQKCYAWIPAASDAKSHCYNPLDWISKNQGQMVDDVQKIGNILIEKQEFWENEARALVNGIILFMISDNERQKSFGEVVRILRSDDTSYLLATALDTLGSTMHPVGYMNIAAFLQKADKEKSGVISTANSRLELWANPIVDKITSRSDFDLRTFKKVCASVFVGLTPDNIQRLRPLMSMFYQQASQFLSSKMPGKDEPYGVMFMLDEFPTLGKMEQILSGIAYFRGYRVKLFLIIQDTQQLKGVYEDAGMNSFLSNSTYRITFAANNVETAKLISELIGNKTVASESMNRPKYLDLNPASRSVHMSKTQRALLLPQEIITLSRDLQIILIEASAPIMCKKIKYYSDPFFTKRLMKAPNLPQQTIDIIGKDGKIRGGNSMESGEQQLKMLQSHPEAQNLKEEGKKDVKIKEDKKS